MSGVIAEGLIQDVRVALRTLRRNPGFAALTVGTLALGISANTLMFGVVDSIVLHSVPYPHPERLFQLWGALSTSPQDRSPLSLPDLSDVQSQATLLQEVGFYRPGMGMAVAELGAAKHLNNIFVSWNLFEVLGVTPFLGRRFLPEDAQPGKDHVAVLSYPLWRELSAKGARVLGETLRLDNQPYTVVGVLPRGQGFPNQFADLWIPESGSSFRTDARTLRDSLAIARMKPDANVRAVESQLQAIASHLGRQYPEDQGLRFRIVPLQEQAVGPLKPVLLLLGGTAGFLLLIVCANVASLVGMRGALRRREIAVRAALGANRWRIGRQLVTESLALAGMGACLALLIGWWGVRAIRTFLSQVPRIDQTHIDGRVLLFSILVAVLSGVAVAVMPGLQLSRPELSDALREGALSSAAGFGVAGGHRAQNLLVTSQVSLAMILLVGAGLLTRSLGRLLAVPLGFDPGHVLTVGLSETALIPLGPTERSLFYQNLLAEIKALPGVRSAAIVSVLPITNRYMATSFRLRGARQRSNAEVQAELQAVSSEYFQTLGIPLLEGRALSEEDREDSPGVVVINQTMAQLFWPGQDPVDQEIDMGRGVLWRVVGVVGDARDIRLETPPGPEMYASYLQTHDLASALVIRTLVAPDSLGSTVVNRIWSLNKGERVLSVAAMNDVIARSVAAPRFRAYTLEVFAGLALVLATTGIYGILAYSVTERTREIGIRMALGAERRHVLTLVCGQGLLLVFAGITLGLVGALLLTRFLSTLLFGVTALDLETFFGAGVLLLAAAALASYVPAHRAAALDPAATLRYE